jgi:ABC-type polysaccharide/polyol phosphate transport system ATPase subunit
MKKRIIVTDLHKSFKIGFRNCDSFLAKITSVFSGKECKRKREILNGLSFDVEEGEILGIIGNNGSGKSTLLRCISQIYCYDKGTIKTKGNLISLINLNIGMHHKLTMKDNIYLCCSFFGLSKKEIDKRFNSILKFSELEDYVNTKLYQFSNGMLQRLAFSIGINCNPDILLLDEVFEVGDEKFKIKSVEKIKDIVKNGASVILVSHDLDMINKYCDRVILLEKGKIIESGKTNKVVSKYKSNKA